MRAGFAITDITPEGPVPLMGYPGPRRLSTGIRDPLQAHVLHVRSGQGGLILVALDLFWLDPLFSAQLRNDIARDTGLAIEQVFIGCTHTHTAPVTSRLINCLGTPAYSEPDPAYLGLIRKRVVQATAQAAATTQPATLEAFNIPDPDHPAESLAGLIVRDAGQSNILSLLLATRRIPNSLGESVPQVSADWPGVFRRELSQQLHIRECSLLILITPPMTPASPPSPPVPLESIAGTLARTVSDRIRTPASPVHSGDPVFTGRRASIILPRRPIPSLWDSRLLWSDARIAYEQQTASTADPATLAPARRAMQSADGMMKFSLSQQANKLDAMLGPYATVEVQVVRIGDTLTLAGLPGLPIGLPAIPPPPGRPWIIVSPVNGDLQGYVSPENQPTALPSPFSPDTLPLFARQVHQLAASL
ncbi:MAG: hypothetical protein A2498_06330 [Lentisphaerae bacterium RIFOXYC12_FULL_60_16]|nr:MAG: hypothetical protein A2498_06330 [Lentisphaerae bacterium RIFOXYC12_FULL_60_16]OGV75074.1 MAG: hypothetical protein A2340_14620 [Lentisphaerae bacterium RIFOXYB12_FULL_60_10]